ncbi:MAG TPA: YkgJ family cysteine cluster protein [Fimbriimonadaceae bacterium]|jgi:hypothetical protein
MQAPNESNPDQWLTHDIEAFANDAARRTFAVMEGHVPEAKVAELARSLAGELDQKISGYQARIKGDTLACRKGCSWCCNEIVVVTAFEILWVYNIANTTFDGAQRKALLERLSVYDEKMQKFYDRPPTFLRAACSLLVNNECSIYENRPFRCRGTSSTDADLCRVSAEFPADGQTVSFLVSQKLIAAGAQKAVAAGSGRILGAKMHDLNRCLKMLFDDPSLAEKVYRGEVVFPPLKPISKPVVFQSDKNSVTPISMAMISLPYKEAWDQARLGNWDRADAAFPKDSLPHLMLKLRTPGIMQSNEQINDCQDRINEALTELENRQFDPIQLLPMVVEHMMDVLPYQGTSVRAALERQGRVFLDKVISRIYPHLCEPIVAPRKPGRFRLGYISSALNNNNGNRWALGWARNHCPDIETFAFNLAPQDIGGRLWERDVEHYYSLQGNGQRVAEFIRSLDLDALIVTDIGARKYDYFFFSMRLARVQCNGWGQPVTSGLPNIDYYLSSDLMEPEDAQKEYTEKLVRLPRSGLCYPRPKSSFWEKGYTPPKREFMPFMAQNIRKWTPTYDPLLKRISDRYGKPLKFMGAFDQESSNIFSQRLDRANVTHVILPPTSNRNFANYLREATVSFDPPDWSGGNTTIEALTYGIPVVALPGPYMRGRHSLAFLQIAGAPGLIASDEEDYFELLFDEERQREAMRNLNADALYEDTEVVGVLDSFLLDTMGQP